MKRKTARELRLEERTRGFYDALMIFEDMWRKRVWITGVKTGGDAACQFMWEGILKAQEKVRDDEREYKDLSLGRRYGEQDAQKD